MSDLSPPPPPPTDETTRRERSARSVRRHLSGPSVLAASGASLVLTAAVVVVASRWEAISVVTRFAGLVTAHVAVVAAAESLRRRLPVTASALAVLAATLAAPVGIAASAVATATWPICITVGGVLVIVACESQWRRWRLEALRAATVVGCGLVATGVAAMSSVPVGLLGVGISMIALVVGWVRRATVLAVAVCLTPWLAALDARDVGPGTLDRIGATGDAARIGVPIASAAAVAVLAIVTRRLASRRLAAATVAAGVHAVLATAVIRPDWVTEIALTLPIGALLLTFVAFRREPFGAIDAAAIVASTGALLFSGALPPWGTSVAVFVIGAQTVSYAAARDERWLLATGGVLVTASLISSWWTTGSDHQVLSAIEPLGIRGGDLLAAIVSVALIGLGAAARTADPSVGADDAMPFLVRSDRAVSSWMAYGPGLALGVSWLLARQLDSDGSWASVVGVAVGVSCIAIGGWSHLGAPLVAGFVSVTGTVVISAGPRLAEAPTWTWIAGGGVALLTLAGLAERADRPMMPLPGRGEPSVIGEFCRRFG